MAVIHRWSLTQVWLYIEYAAPWLTTFKWKKFSVVLLFPGFNTLRSIFFESFFFLIKIEIRISIHPIQHYLRNPSDTFFLKNDIYMYLKVQISPKHNLFKLDSWLIKIDFYELEFCNLLCKVRFAWVRLG